MTTTSPTVANHHAHHPGFAGPTGVAYALLFAWKGGGRARMINEVAGTGPDDHVVDLGCGPGNAVRAAAARGARATGVDPSTAMLRVARLLTRRSPGVRWAVGAAESIPVADGDATVVWSVACVHHWADVDAGLGEVRRVLAPGGRLLAVERQVEPGATGTASHGWLPAQAERFAEACRAHGFADVEVTHRTGPAGTVLVVTAVQP